MNSTSHAETEGEKKHTKVIFKHVVLLYCILQEVAVTKIVKRDISRNQNAISAMNSYASLKIVMKAIIFCILALCIPCIVPVYWITSKHSSLAHVEELNALYSNL